MAHARADPLPSLHPCWSRPAPRLKHPSRHHRPCTHGVSPVCSFLLSAILPFQAVSGNWASCQLVPLSLHFCSLSSSLQISYQRVLKRQPEWFIHPGSSVSQLRAQIFDHATALRPAPPVGLRITPVLSNRVLSARLPVPPPESQQLALRLPPPAEVSARARLVPATPPRFCSLGSLQFSHLGH